MKRRWKIILLCINILMCAFIAVCTALFMNGWSLTVRIVCYCIASVGLIFGLVTFFIDKESLFKSGFVIVAFSAITVVLISIISGVAKLDNYPTDGEKIDRLVEFIEGLGGWGYLVYFIIQVLQVVILPIPAVVCYVPGSLIWGPVNATLIASAGVITGSVISYFIGKVCGKPAVVWIAGSENVEKYAPYLAKRGKVLFVIMQILPFFPDDILCMLAGLTGMNFAFFSVSIILIRPAIIATYCFLGSGTVIPFSGWGIAVWAAIFIVCIVLAVLSFKYQDKIENWLINKLKNLKRKNKGGKVGHTALEDDGKTASDDENGNTSEGA